MQNASLLFLLVMKRLISMKKLLLFTILIVPFLVSSQKMNLDELRDQIAKSESERELRVEKYALEAGIPIIQELESGITICLRDVVDGVPTYVKTYNLGARTSTGADLLGIDGDLGLDLDGSDISIAVWDGGLVRTSHLELVGRVTPSDGSSTFSRHATHVTGTIIASGVNNSAMGMAVGGTANTYDFNNDTQEMGNAIGVAQEGVIVSNHSYGTIAGWDNSQGGSQWFGNTNISELEDSNFGYYNSTAQQWDNLVYNSPYYTIVKSAGNDRGDSGDGSHPPDGPYDIISTSGTAKNIITIGAVNKLGVYSAPSNVVMSSFSGWGPTDDGRIKPDFVAAGVSLFSSFSGADDDYGSLSGTSMSAPNATGTFVLLQQLHKKLNGGELMKSSELKGLVAHTAHEAGRNDGPDYEYGWGLINGRGAAELLISENNTNRVITEVSLEDGQTYSVSINPEIGTEVKATICWIDPAGNIPVASLDPKDTILVNDLDLRIASEGESNLPWILDPEFPNLGATRGDNFRDNIEVVAFTATETNYDLTVSHKETLATGRQNFNLILTYTPEAAVGENILYWVGSDNKFATPSNWATQSGGSGGIESPGENSTLIFDNNSFADDSSQQLQFEEDTRLGNLVYLADNELVVDLGINDLSIAGKVSLNSKISFTGSGSVLFDGSDVQRLAAGDAFSQMHLIFEGETSSWIVGGPLSADIVEVRSGFFDLSHNELTARQLLTTGEFVKSIEVDSATLYISESMILDAATTSFEDEESTIVAIDNAVEIDFDGMDSKANIVVNSVANIKGLGSLKKLEVSGEVEVESDIEIELLKSNAGGSLIVGDNVTVALEEIENESTAESKFAISAVTNGKIRLDGHRKICLDNLTIENVDQIGDATISTGSSALTNADGWISRSCDEVLFSDFQIQYGCAGSIVTFENLSTGSFENVLWSFDELGSSENTNSEFIFSEEGSYEVELTVSNTDGSSSYTMIVEIGGNTLTSGSISIVGDVLLSELSADTYQWYKDGEAIAGATEKFYDYGGVAGEYFVVLYNQVCNMPSETIEIVIAGIEEEANFSIYPNPSSVDHINVVNKNNLEMSIQVIDLKGRIVFSKESHVGDFTLERGNLKDGIYSVRVEAQKSVYHFKVIFE